MSSITVWIETIVVLNSRAGEVVNEDYMVVEV
jgi:hypothetical protein